LNHLHDLQLTDQLQLTDHLQLADCARGALTIRRTTAKLLRSPSLRAPGGDVAAPAFVKNPKFIGGTIIFLWVAYVVYWNYRLSPIDIQLVPFVKPAQLSVSSVIIGAALFGFLATMTVQFFWHRGRSKNGSDAVTASAASTKPVT
jgi:hypothetical protein